MYALPICSRSDAAIKARLSAAIVQTV